MSSNKYKHTQLIPIYNCWIQVELIVINKKSVQRNKMFLWRFHLQQCTIAYIRDTDDNDYSNIARRILKNRRRTTWSFLFIISEMTILGEVLVSFYRRIVIEMNFLRRGNSSFITLEMGILQIFKARNIARFPFLSIKTQL